MESEQTSRRAPGTGWEDHILFLDDDVAILKSLKRMLVQKKLGWRCSFASTASEALAILEVEPVDIFVSDIKMPDRDGFHVLKGLREDTRWDKLPVVMCTALENPYLKAKAMELGAIDLIHKPIKPSEMVARISTILHERNKHAKLEKKAFEYKQLLLENSKQLEASKVEMILRLAKAAEYRSSDDANHVVRVGYYAKFIADRMGLVRSCSDQLFITSPLHDIGNLAIPDDVLLKKEKLTEKEMAIVRGHCKLGYDLLGPNNYSHEDGDLTVNTMAKVVFSLYDFTRNDLLQRAAEISLNHHEWFDGSGYPYGKHGDDIPLSARIVAIADTYDSIRSERVYKRASTHEEAMAVMQSLNGCQFDPKIFKVFKENNEAIAKMFS